MLRMLFLTCAKIQRKVLMFEEVGATESIFWDSELHDIRPEHFVNIK